MSTEAPISLTTIYSPIQEEIERLEAFLEQAFAREEPFIVQLLRHVHRFRGKQIRPALLLMAGRVGGTGVNDDHVKIAAVVELIHTATLVHDDILDDAALRRSVETLHRRWGERVAVLMGDFIYSRAFWLSTQVSGMAQVFSQTTNTICEGELLQIRHRFKPEIPEEIYLDIIRKKTAILYAVACEVGGRLSGLNATECQQLREFGLHLGMAFQIVDDCMDYAGEEDVAGKSLGTDLHQGKPTLPLIHLLRSLPEDRRASLVAVLSEPMSAEQEAEVSEAVRANDALKSAFEQAEGYVEAANAALSNFPMNVRESFELVSEYVLRRRR